MSRRDTDQYHEIFLSGVPLLDVRAPVEFAQGAFPGAHNAPLMNDEERHQVGLTYKRKGQDAAIRLGHELVSGSVKDERVQAWVAFANAHPEGYLYCFRGGLRSKISQQWIAEAGIQYPRIVGGYKAMRTFLLESMQANINRSSFLIVGGLTGSGKTDVIRALPSAIDLEEIAHHRGSSFGKHADEQPSQIDFDNKLAIAFLRHESTRPQTPIVLEDESRLIGRCALPLELRHRMQQDPVVLVEEETSPRVERILRDYVLDLSKQFRDRLGEDQGFEAYSARLLESLTNLQKRLGGERHSRLDGLMREALSVQKKTGDVDAHREWIRPLLVEYYDPMYEHQLKEKQARIIFRGDMASVLVFLKNRTA